MSPIPDLTEEEKALKAKLATEQTKLAADVSWLDAHPWAARGLWMAAGAIGMAIIRHFL